MAQTFENWLVVSDIDGTLNNKLRKLPKRNYNAIKEFTEKGGNFTLASGRMVSSLKRNYDRVTPNQPAIVINGAGIYDYNQEKCFGAAPSAQRAGNLLKKFQSFLILTATASMWVYFLMIMCILSKKACFPEGKCFLINLIMR